MLNGGPFFFPDDHNRDQGKEFRLVDDITREVEREKRERRMEREVERKKEKRDSERKRERGGSQERERKERVRGGRVRERRNTYLL